HLRDPALEVRAGSDHEYARSADRAGAREYGGGAAHAAGAAGDGGAERRGAGRGAAAGAGDPGSVAAARRGAGGAGARGGGAAAGDLPEPGAGDAAGGDGAGAPATAAGGRRPCGDRGLEDRAKGTRPGRAVALDPGDADRGDGRTNGRDGTGGIESRQSTVVSRQSFQTNWRR